MKKLLAALQAVWFAFRGHPLTNAREEHKLALRAAVRASAEVEYHTQLMQFFDEAARSMDPHSDWHHFAALKDAWHDHKTERLVEWRRSQAAEAKLQAAGERLKQLELNQVLES